MADTNESNNTKTMIDTIRAFQDSVRREKLGIADKSSNEADQRRFMSEEDYAIMVSDRAKYQREHPSKNTQTLQSDAGKKDLPNIALMSKFMKQR